MVRGVTEPALGVGAEFDIGAGDTGEDYLPHEPVIESPSDIIIAYIHFIWLLCFFQHSIEKD